MKHTVTSEADKPGMTLDQLQAAVERARRSGAKGDELIRARLFGRGGELRSISIDLTEPPLPGPAGGTGAKAAGADPDRPATRGDKR
ncbi:MAG TPA: hypothetical protein VFX70_23410 [Mycobacteriales bacterium]|nr:hypothetical protein [Mycobacteriales bacterium]